jgi:poly-beta-1,6-N-acetyl-D-glucosamine synthase
MESPRSGRICAIIPAKNEEIVIAKSIDSLIGAGLSGADIYVVDDGSTDHTGLIALNCGVNVLRNCSSLGKVGSIKRAVEHFELDRRYDYISLLDADSQVSGNYFSEVRKLFSDDVALICGYVESLEHNWITAARALEYMWGQAIYKRGQDKMGTILVSPGCASTYKSSIFAKLELRGDTFVEDMDMTFQVHRRKLGRIVFSETAISYTQDPRTISDYCRQMHRWYFGMWQVILKHRVPISLERIDFEIALLISEAFFIPIFYLVSLIKFPFALLGVFLADEIFSICIAMYFSIKTKRTDILKYCPLFPLVKLINSAIFMQTFVEIIVLRKKLKQWFTPDRYAIK